MITTRPRGITSTTIPQTKSDADPRSEHSPNRRIQVRIEDVRGGKTGFSPPPDPTTWSPKRSWSQHATQCRTPPTRNCHRLAERFVISHRAPSAKHSAHVGLTPLRIERCIKSLCMAHLSSISLCTTHAAQFLYMPVVAESGSCSFGAASAA